MVGSELASLVSFYVESVLTLFNFFDSIVLGLCTCTKKLI